MKPAIANYCCAPKRDAAAVTLSKVVDSSGVYAEISISGTKLLPFSLSLPSPSLTPFCQPSKSI